MAKIPDCHHAIVDVLRLLSSADEQLAYERRVPQISVTDELLSIWFDDKYLPDDRTFRGCFSDSELQAMAAFNDYFDERADRLPDPSNGVAEWLKDENWRQVMHGATELLAILREREPREP